MIIIRCFNNYRIQGWYPQKWGRGNLSDQLWQKAGEITSTSGCFSYKTSQAT
jgi:hypothetical protein